MTAFIEAAMAAGAPAQSQIGSPQDTIRCTEITIDGSSFSPEANPKLRALIYKPKKKPEGLRPAYLHLHGGGMIFGSPETSVMQSRRIVENHDCIVIVPDYRLAPETTFPGAIEDCYAALNWMVQNAADLGIDTKHIVIGGESAGGGLAASLALLVRDRGEIDIAGQVLIYPMLDDRTGTSREPSVNSGEFIWTAELNRLAWTSVLGQGAGGANTSLYAAAARAEDLSGLPPVYMMVGSLDLFAEETKEYAKQLTLANVPNELHVYQGGYHAFDAVESSALSQRAARDLHHAIATMFPR